MLGRRSALALLVVLGLTLPAFGQKATLKWKFEKDKSFFQTMTTNATQTMTVTGTPLVQKQSQTFYFKWTPKEEKDGKVTLEQEIIGVKVDIDIGGSKVSYDSTSPDNTANPLNEFFKALIGSKFTLTLDTAKGVVEKVEGNKEFIDKLAKQNPQMKQLLDKILNEKSLKEMAEPTFAPISGKEVEKGKPTREPLTTKLDLGPMGTYETTYTYTYEGPNAKDKMEKIGVKTDLKYLPPDDKASAGMPFKIKEAKLEPSDATGSIDFDPAKGRIVKSETSVKIKGKLKIEIGGQTTEVDLSQDQNTKIQTDDKNPIEKK